MTVGNVYLPKLRSGRRSKRYVITWYAGGRKLDLNTGSESKRAAEQMLREREGEAAGGAPVLRPRVDKILYDEAATDLRMHYATTGERDEHDVNKIMKHLDDFFRGRRLAAIRPALIAEYVSQRQQEGAANGTCNRELAMLRKLLALAVEHEKLRALPKIRKLKEADPRSGFVEHAVFERVVKHMPEPHALALRIAYATAWRREEVFALAWRNVNLEAGSLHLEVGSTKNNEPRTVYLPANLVAQLRTHRATIEALQRKVDKIIPDVFVRLTGKLAGQRIGSFRKRWTKACAAAGVPGLLVHDLRRSGIRNMVRRGVHDHVAMKISGHKTRSVFQRYDIVDDKDLQAAAEKLTVPSDAAAPLSSSQVRSLRGGE